MIEQREYAKELGEFIKGNPAKTFEECCASFISKNVEILEGFRELDQVQLSAKEVDGSFDSSDVRRMFSISRPVDTAFLELVSMPISPGSGSFSKTNSEPMERHVFIKNYGDYISKTSMMPCEIELMTYLVDSAIKEGDPDNLDAVVLSSLRAMQVSSNNSVKFSPRCVKEIYDELIGDNPTPHDLELLVSEIRIAPERFNSRDNITLESNVSAFLEKKLDSLQVPEELLERWNSLDDKAFVDAIPKRDEDGEDDDGIPENVSDLQFNVSLDNVEDEDHQRQTELQEIFGHINEWVIADISVAVSTSKVDSIYNKFMTECDAAIKDGAKIDTEDVTRAYVSRKDTIMKSEKKDEIERFSILCRAKITAPRNLDELNNAKSNIDKDIDQAMARQFQDVGDINALETLRGEIDVLYQGESLSLARAEASEKPNVPSVTRPSFSTKNNTKHTLIKREGTAIENKVNSAADVKKLESILGSSTTIEKEAALKEFRKETGNTYKNSVVSRQGTPVEELKRREEEDKESKSQLFSGIKKLIQALDKTAADRIQALDNLVVTDQEAQGWREFLESKINSEDPKEETGPLDPDPTLIGRTTADKEEVVERKWSSDPEWFDNFDPKAEELAKEELKFAQTYARALASRREFLKMKETLNGKYKESGIDPIKEDID